MKINLYLPVLLLGGVLTRCQSPEPPSGQLVQVQRVLSGQTLEILDRSQKIPLTRQVRLLGVETPDLQQEPWGKQAKIRLQELIQDQPVRLELEGKNQDSSGRLWAYVWQKNIFVNEQLVKEGYVLARTSPVSPRFSSPSQQYEKQLVYAQEEARIMGRGIWNPRHPLRQTPSQFRQQRRFLSGNSRSD